MKTIDDFEVGGVGIGDRAGGELADQDFRFEAVDLLPLPCFFSGEVGGEPIDRAADRAAVVRDKVPGIEPALPGGDREICERAQREGGVAHGDRAHEFLGLGSVGFDLEFEAFRERLRRELSGSVFLACQIQEADASGPIPGSVVVPAGGLVEPVLVAEAGSPHVSSRGLRALYVAMTRPTRRLRLVGTRSMPALAAAAAAVAMIVTEEPADG